MRTKIPRLRQKLEELIQRAKSIFSILHECKMQITEVDFLSFRMNILKALRSK